jgi:hypothetical protein
LHIGLIELAVFVSGFALMVRNYFKKRKISPLLIISFISLLVYIFLMSKAATPLFYLVKPLGNVQHQWRFLSGIIFLAPMVLALILSGLPKKFKNTFIVLLVASLVFIRIPQARGKNYVITPESKYFSSKENLYASVMNTLWTGETQSYLVKDVKGEIVEGEGEIISRDEHNSWRKYEVSAKENIRMVDNTFFFPGWKVFVDGIETEVEFQDVNYRGVITYMVPSGEHNVLVRFENTKTRNLANVVTVLSLLVLGVAYFYREAVSSL